MKTSKTLLLIAAILNFALALFQGVITTSPEWSRYFGASESVANNLPLLYFAGFTVAIIFAVFGFYTLSAAGVIRKLPALRVALILIASLFVLRGLMLIPEIVVAHSDAEISGNVPARMIVSSVISLAIGIVYIGGIIGAWRSLSAARETPVFKDDDSL